MSARDAMNRALEKLLKAASVEVCTHPINPRQSQQT